MQIYIDTDSGTWGIAENNLVIFNPDWETMNKLMHRPLSDSEIIDIGLSHRHSQ
jgi:hypothetical protein